MKLDELKEKNITEFNSDEITEHIKTVMSLEKEEMKEYLLFALDNYYVIDEETKNTEEVETFFSYEDFKPVYAELMEENDNETDIQ
jgi:hypothetical protein